MLTVIATRCPSVFVVLTVVVLYTACGGIGSVAQAQIVLPLPDTSRVDTSLSLVSTTPDTGTAPVGRCSPTTAFILGALLPGGGQFYLGDIGGGVESIVTDVILAAALASGGTGVAGTIMFIETVHVIEGLFAAQSCRVRNSTGCPEDSTGCPGQNHNQ